MLAIAVLASILGGVASTPLPSSGSPLATDLNPYPTKPRITFKEDGTFKLTVFSDLHFGENPWDSWGPEHDQSSVKLMNTILGDEKPDYAVINGDLITGENTFKENATTLIDQIVAPFINANVPFSTTQGNHDNQPNITHEEEILREQSLTELSYTRMAPPGVGGDHGPGNYWVPVYRNAYDQSPVLILWFFDSRGGWKTSTEFVPDWVDASVAGWIQSETQSMESAWGPASQRGAVAFVHIPPDIAKPLQDNLDSTKSPGDNEDVLGDGSTQNPNDSTFWDALNLNVPNLHAVISGHDHGNNWCARDTNKNVVFCFNKHSGYGGYTRGWAHGVRNLLFTSPDPTAGVKTWIREEDGTVKASITLDSNYV
ncbi:Metallo-dependent phosphatase [Pluteus cervinus]|uniref:Metallo-dependent phosphatase n=1 Tax=Pluteus cervinus TaxID=181527 RepID=A0ACD3AVG9_9AGAR|nr:Metallo-dependent phosphatase [Pluteus cervinus]